MKIQDATNIYVGSSTASKVYLGNVKVWPSTPVIPVSPPDSVQFSSSPDAGWGVNYITDGSTTSLSGTKYFSAFSSNNSNITRKYRWTFTGSLTVTGTETDTDNPDRGVLVYQINIGSGQGQIIISDPNDSTNVFVTATINGL